MGVFNVVVALIVGLCAGVICVALGRLPRTRVALPVYAFVASGLAWAVGDVIASHATEMTAKSIGLTLLYSGSIPIGTLWWILVLRWAEDENAGLPFSHPAWTLAPLAFAGAMWIAMITNPLHGEFLTPVVGGRNVYRPLWYVMAAPNYGLILAALGVELAVAWRVARREVRRQAAFLIAASLVTLVGNGVYVVGLFQLDLAPLVLSVSGALLVVGMAREGLFGVLPWALPGIAADHPDGLVVVGPEGNIRFANQRAHALLAPVEVASGSSFGDAMRDARLRPESSVLGRVERESPFAILSRPGGVLFRVDAETPRWLQLTATVVRTARGRTKGQCVRIQDRTAQKEAELHVRQARRLDSVADLARTLSRQFRGAFTLVHDNAELLLESPGLGPDHERKLVRIVEASKYGSELAQELQLYTGSVNTKRVVVELSEVVAESCALVDDDVPRDVRIELVRTEQLLPVHVDAIQLRHSIFNVLMNAIEAMEGKSGGIRVSTGSCFVDPTREPLVCGAEQPAGEFAYVAVRDAGGGMDPEVEERAFEPFFSTRGKDRGNGLPIVLGIARAHDALVALENDWGRGTDLTLFFPLERRTGS